MTKQEFNEYVQAQGADILRFCRMTTASKIEGDELYQDTMLKLLEQLQHLNVDKNLKSYTLSVAIFLWKNQRRKYARRKRLASFESYEAQDESGNLKVISAEDVYKRQLHGFSRSDNQRLQTVHSQEHFRWQLPSVRLLPCLLYTSRCV